MKPKRVIALVLAGLIVLTGFAFGSRAVSKLRNSIVSQHEDKLSATAESVDYSMDSFFRLCADTLGYLTERRDFTAAEQSMRTTGVSGELLNRLNDNILLKDMHVDDIIAVSDGQVVLSAHSTAEYILPAAPGERFVCADTTGRYYVGIACAHAEITYVALMDLTELTVYLAESSSVNANDRMLLVDRDGQYLICRHNGSTNVSPATEENIAVSPARSIALNACGTDTREVSVFNQRRDAGESIVGYALIGSGAGKNMLFTVCVMDAYDENLAALTKHTSLFVMGFAMILIGVAASILLLMDTNRKAEIALKQLREREETLVRINERTKELAHAQRLETIGVMTSGIAHEFNNLLTPIMSYSLMTLEKLPAEEEELYDNVLEIYNASQRAKTVVSRLGDLSRKNTPETFRPASVDESVKKALSIAETAKPEGVEVKLDLRCGEVLIRINEIQMCQLFLNLILNAYGAMGDTGVLGIRSEYDDASVRVRVRDNGCGIPAEHCQHIFEPFFTTKGQGEGTGLGLAIAAQVAEEHKGSLTVESKPGDTVFTVVLPRDAE